MSKHFGWHDNVWKDIERIQELNKKTSDDDLSFLAKVGAFSLGMILVGIFAIPLIIYSIWAHALVGATLWGWFVVPMFGLEPISMAQAWGLSLLIHLWTYSHHTCKSEDERQVSEKIAEFAGLMIRPWFMLLVGWICYHYFLAK